MLFVSAVLCTAPGGPGPCPGPVPARASFIETLLEAERASTASDFSTSAGGRNSGTVEPAVPDFDAVVNTHGALWDGIIDAAPSRPVNQLVHPEALLREMVQETVRSAVSRPFHSDADSAKWTKEHNFEDYLVPDDDKRRRAQVKTYAEEQAPQKRLRETGPEDAVFSSLDARSSPVSSLSSTSSSLSSPSEQEQDQMHDSTNTFALDRGGQSQSPDSGAFGTLGLDDLVPDGDLLELADLFQQQQQPQPHRQQQNQQQMQQKQQQQQQQQQQQPPLHHWSPARDWPSTNREKKGNTAAAEWTRALEPQPRRQQQQQSQPHRQQQKQKQQQQQQQQQQQPPLHRWSPARAWPTTNREQKANTAEAEWTRALETRRDLQGALPPREIRSTSLRTSPLHFAGGLPAPAELIESARKIAFDGRDLV